jgi:hypothetical protein
MLPRAPWAVLMAGSISGGRGAGSRADPSSGGDAVGRAQAQAVEDKASQQARTVARMLGELEARERRCTEDLCDGPPPPTAPCLTDVLPTLPPLSVSTSHPLPRLLLLFPTAAALRCPPPTSCAKAALRRPPLQ